LIVADASAQLRAIALKLRAAGEREILNGVRRELRIIAAPAVEAVRAKARADLPKSGGLNDEQADQPITVSVLSGARTAGVRIRTKRLGSMQTDAGYVRHPIFGKWRKGQKSQSLPQAAGWFSDTLAHEGDAVAVALEARIDAINAEIEAI
jgi:hypothetical protein